MLNKRNISEFYTARRGTYASIYDVWERELPYKDWVTPAVFDRSYRDRLAVIISETIQNPQSARILSVGCGNAFVEGLLVRGGLKVDGVDLHERSVLHARRRGVQAVVGDIMNWSPKFEEYDVIFMDGVLGHLYDPDSPILHLALVRLRRWLA